MFLLLIFTESLPANVGWVLMNVVDSDVTKLQTVSLWPVASIHIKRGSEKCQSLKIRKQPP